MDMNRPQACTECSGTEVDPWQQEEGPCVTCRTARTPSDPAPEPVHLRMHPWQGILAWGGEDTPGWHRLDEQSRPPIWPVSDEVAAEATPIDPATVPEGFWRDLLPQIRGAADDADYDGDQETEAALDAANWVVSYELGHARERQRQAHLRLRNVLRTLRAAPPKMVPDLAAQAVAAAQQAGLDAGYVPDPQEPMGMWAVVQLPEVGQVCWSVPAHRPREPVQIQMYGAGERVDAFLGPYAEWDSHARRYRPVSILHDHGDGVGDDPDGPPPATPGAAAMSA